MDLMTLGGVDPVMIPIVGIITGVSALVVTIVGSMLFKGQQTRQREQSRREIAAYIAEGSMTPEHGERLLRAGE